MNSAVALVTGGCRGIGLGISRALVKAGFNLALTGMRPVSEIENSLSQMVQGKNSGRIVRYFQSDLSDIKQHPELLTAIEEQLGGVDTLVLNAGIAQSVRGDLLQMTAEDFDRLMRTNLRGNFFLASSVAKQMLAHPAPQTFRSIQFITSISASMASPERAAYCISKAGVSMAASLFALRLATEGIAVYEVRPGIIATDMTAGVKSKYDKAIEDGLVPLRRWGQAEDIGKSIVALATGSFSFGIGNIINLDGGLSIKKL